MSSSGSRWTTALATFLLAVTFVAWVVGGMLSVLFSGEPLPLIDVLWVLSFLVFPVVGWLIATKLPSNPLGWIYLAFAVLAALGSAMEELATIRAYAGNYAGAAILMQGGGWLLNLSLTLVFVPGVLLFLMDVCPVIDGVSCYGEPVPFYSSVSYSVYSAPVQSASILFGREEPSSDAFCNSTTRFFCPSSSV